MSLLDDLTTDERLVLVVYDDATGKPLKSGDTIKGNPTIGIGRNLLVGISAAEATYLAQNDIKRVQGQLDVRLPWWRSLPEPAQRGLGNMAFNLGMRKLQAFPAMLSALNAGDWSTAAAEALNSAWAKQVGDRAERIAGLFDPTRCAGRK